MGAITRTIDRDTLAALWEADKLKYGMDENGNLNLMYADTDGTQKIKGDIGFVASVDLVIDPSVNYKSVAASITATTYPGTAQAVFGFTSRNIVIANDSVQDVTFSFNGTTNDTVIKAGEVITFNETAQIQVFFKVASGSSAIRVLAV